MVDAVLVGAVLPCSEPSEFCWEVSKQRLFDRVTRPLSCRLVTGSWEILSQVRASSRLSEASKGTFFQGDWVVRGAVLPGL
jgi:hypothetical protein